MEELFVVDLWFVKYFNPLTGVFLVRCFRDDVHRVGFALGTNFCCWMMKDVR